MLRGATKSLQQQRQQKQKKNPMSNNGNTATTVNTANNKTIALKMEHHQAQQKCHHWMTSNPDTHDEECNNTDNDHPSNTAANCHLDDEDDSSSSCDPETATNDDNDFCNNNNCNGAIPLLSVDTNVNTTANDATVSSSTVVAL